MFSTPVTAAGVALCALFSGGYFMGHQEGIRHTGQAVKRGFGKAVHNIEDEIHDIGDKFYSAEQRAVKGVKSGANKLWKAEQAVADKMWRAEQAAANKLKRGATKVANKVHDVEENVLNKYKNMKAKLQRKKGGAPAAHVPHSLLELLTNPDQNHDGQLDFAEMQTLMMGDDGCWGLLHLLLAVALVAVLFSFCCMPAHDDAHEEPSSKKAPIDNSTLPKGWDKSVCKETGNTYFYNEQKGTRQWNQPTA